MSGDPVTFRQALYEIYYVARPEVPVDVAERVLPRLDKGAAELAARAAPRMGYRAGGVDGAPAPAAGTAAPITKVEPEAEEAATQVVFRFPAPLTIASGQTALLPIVQREIPAERLWLYQPEASARSPLASVRLRNDEDTTLPAGAMTVYERSSRGVVTYVGDARLAPLPPGESRIVSFAVDRKVRIDREERGEEVFSRAKIQGGVLEIVRTARKVTVYTIVGAAREPRVVLIEHPRIAGWDLAEPREGVETTSDRYRIRREVAAGETARVTVSLEQPISHAVALTGLERADRGLPVVARDPRGAARGARAARGAQGRGRREAARARPSSPSSRRCAWSRSACATTSRPCPRGTRSTSATSRRWASRKTGSRLCRRSSRARGRRWPAPSGRSPSTCAACSLTT